MHTEDRLQATLNFTLRNAFETLNKFSVWASTDESTVQFNLIDAFPDGSGYTGNGMAVEPIVIPSLSAVNGDLFGKSNTTVNKIFFWNLDFKNDKGWTFSKDTGKNLQTNILGDSRPLLKLDTVDFYVSDSSKSVFDGGVFASSLYINPDKYSKTDDNDYEFSYDSEEQRVFGIANIVDIRNGTDYGSTINLVPSKYINTLMYYSNIAAQHKSIYAISYCPNNSTYDRYNGTPYNIISFNPSVSSQGSYAVIAIGNGVDKTLNIITKGRELQQTFDVAYSTIGGVFNSISSNYARVLSPIDSEYDITLGVNSSKGTILQSLLEKARTITFDTYTENSSTSFNYINLTCFDTTSDNSKIEVKSSGDVEISGLNKLVLASSNVQIKGAIDDENSLISVKNNIVSIPTLFDKSKSQYRLSGVQTFRGSIVNPNLILAGINNSIVTKNEPLFSADFTRTAIDEGDVFDDFKVSAISETETYFVTKKTQKNGKTIFNIHLRNSSNISTTDTNNWSVYLEGVQVKDFILIKNKIYFIGIIGDKNQITRNNSDGTTAWKGLDKINLYSFDITDYSQNGKKIELDNLLEDLIEEYDSVPFQDANSNCRGLSSFITSSDSFTFSDFNENYIVIARNCKINCKMELTCQRLYDKEGDWTQAGLVATPDIITPYVLLYDISEKSVHVVAAEIYADLYDGMEYFYDIKSVKIIDNYCNDYSETNKNKDLCSINPEFDEIYISKNNNVGRFVITENGVQTFNNFDITKETNSSYIAESSIEAFKTRYANYTALNYNPGVCLMMNLRWNFACFTTSFSSLCAVSISKSDKNIIMVKEMNEQDIYSDASLKLIGKCLETSSNHSLSDVNILNATSTCDILDNIENTNSLVLYKTDNLYDNGSYNISKSYAKTNYISQDDENSPYYMCTSTTLYNKNTLNYIYYVLNTMYLNYSLDSSIKKLSIGSSDSSEYKFDFNDNSQTTPSISIENIISETEDYSLCGALSNLVYDSYTFSNYRRSNTIVSKKDEEYYISSFSVAKQDSTFEPKYNGVMVGDSYESVFGTNTISIDSDNVYYYTLNKTYGTDDLVSNSITVRCNKEKSSTKKYIIYITKNGTDIQIDGLFTGEEKKYDPGCVDIRNSYIDYINVDIDPLVATQVGVVESQYIYTDLAFGYSIRDEDPQKSIFSSSKSNDIFTDFRISNAGVIDVVSGLNFNSYKESDDSIPYFDKSILESDGLIAIQKEGTKLIIDKTIYRNQFGVHVGIISYVVNHMKTKDETIRHHSGYAIKYSNTFSRFEIYYENNKYSGYKQPFAYYKNDSVAYSTSNQNDILKTNTINLPEKNCYIADTISGRAYIYITSTNVYVTNYMHTIVLRISLNALSSSREGNIIDEFGDTCSMKANYLCGGYTFYETSIGDYIGKIVLGLTEVAQVGVDCD